MVGWLTHFQAPLTSRFLFTSMSVWDIRRNDTLTLYYQHMTAVRYSLVFVLCYIKTIAPGVS